METPLLHPFENTKKTIDHDGKKYTYFDLTALEDERYEKLPYSIRVLLESAVRNCDEFQIKKKDVENILNWHANCRKEIEIPFKPARVILQDFTGVPAVVDFAAMREAIKKLGGNVERINPLVPADLVIDHSVQVDFARSPQAYERNLEMEFQRNEERFKFLKWGAKVFENMLIVPPGSGIVHQVNLEYLARSVFNHKGILYPDSLVGTDSHTTMINGLGIVGWGVGGIEAEAVMLGQSISMVLPEVVGFKLTGKLPSCTTATDLVLTITETLRKKGVVGKFVEFYGPGVIELALADRSTISNMAPEYGATMGYFPTDKNSIDYLRQTGRSEEKLSYIEAYLRANRLFRDYASGKDPVFSDYLELDLSTIQSSVSGPKRPHDRVVLSEMKQDFEKCLTNKLGFKGFDVPLERRAIKASFEHEGHRFDLMHGSVVIAAITSCTNTSNPSVMLGAGLLAKKAVERGLSVAPFIKTSLSPGSEVVTRYLKNSGLELYLNHLGFNLTGYGCMTCIGNSGEIAESVAKAIEKENLVCAAVLSGNRNFEGRVNPLTKANYLCSPPLVVAYALAGRVDINFDKEPVGYDSNGNPVYLNEIWPTRDEVCQLEQQHVLPDMFKQVYDLVASGKSNPRWNQLPVTNNQLYTWDLNSTYIKCPPFFHDISLALKQIKPIEKAYCLLNLGDSITTDHISPAGNISRNSPAARYLASKGINPKDFNSYGSRRGNDEIMARGTFANTQIFNKIVGKTGPKTVHFPSNELLDVFDASERYRQEGYPLIILAGADYGSGSSRDWAAKGPYLLGVKAVIAINYERIHRSNLIGMGIIPLQFKSGQNAETLGLTGKECFNIEIPEKMVLGQEIRVRLDDGRSFDAKLRFDTEVEMTYYRHGGILHYMLRKLCQ